MGIKQVPLDHSSLDFNGGEPQVTKVNASMTDATRTLLALADKRGLSIVDKDCSADDECELTFKADDTIRSKTQGGGTISKGKGTTNTYTANLTFSSRLYFNLSSAEGSIKVSALGVPTINAKLSCPDSLVNRGKCKPEPFNVQGEQTPAEAFQGLWGVDISGKAEAEMIKGMLVELELAGAGTAKVSEP